MKPTHISVVTLTRNNECFIQLFSNKYYISGKDEKCNSAREAIGKVKQRYDLKKSQTQLVPHSYNKRRDFEILGEK